MHRHFLLPRLGQSIDIFNYPCLHYAILNLILVNYLINIARRWRVLSRHRYIVQKTNNKLHLHVEPAGRVSPKFPKMAKINSFEVANDAEISLLCDAQAFPAPAFRSVHINIFYRHFLNIFQLLCNFYFLDLFQ